MFGLSFARTTDSLFSMIMREKESLRCPGRYIVGSVRFMLPNFVFRERLVPWSVDAVWDEPLQFTWSGCENMSHERLKEPTNAARSSALRDHAQNLYFLCRFVQLILPILAFIKTGRSVEKDVCVVIICHTSLILTDNYGKDVCVVIIYHTSLILTDNYGNPCLLLHLPAP